MSDLKDNVELDNILVHQKDIILSYLNQGKQREARACLLLVRELWKRCHYSYKHEELKQRLKTNG